MFGVLAIAFIAIHIYFSNTSDFIRYLFLYTLGLPSVIANKLIVLKIRFCQDSTFGCWSANLIIISSIIYGFIFIILANSLKILRRIRLRS